MCDTMGKLLPNGTALFGKNSDRSPNEPQTLYYYPAAIHSNKSVLTTYIKVDQVEKTKAIILSRPSWLWGGEMGVNECGVCIGNEAVFTKGRYDEMGLTGMDMLRLALERSENAKEALERLIHLLERYGQGGNCGYDHKFYYDNSFLIMDGKELYILETSGENWVYKKTSCGAISNRLSIQKDGTTYGEGSCNFAKKHTEPVYSHFSQATKRRNICSSAIEKATCINDVFAALRQHTHEKDPLCTASVGSPCMHYGGLVGDHTTASLVVEWDENGKMTLWATGRSMPCVSIFKPFAFGNTVVPVFESTDKYATNYWLDAEIFNRSLIGHKLPSEYYVERDSIEAELISRSKNTSFDEMKELSKFALEKEADFVHKWEKIEFEKGKVSNLFAKNWQKKNAVFEHIKRITEMEMYFDTLQDAYDRNPNSIATDSSLQAMLKKLITYYDGPDWRSDYESDEHGKLPQGLKRGVLSEDGVYNFLVNLR